MAPQILVIGHNGQLARSLATQAELTNRPITCIGRPKLDLSDEVCLRMAVNENAPDIIVNAAAYTAVDKAEDNPSEAFMVNETGPSYLAGICSELDIPLIHISTDYVYDGNKPTPYLEEDTVNPLGVYGASKLAGEKTIMERCPKHLILRTAWVYSEFGQNFLKTILRLAGESDTLNIVDDQIGCPTDAMAFAGVILELADRIADGQKKWGLYHAAGSQMVTWFGFARDILVCAEKQGIKAPRLKAINTSDYPTRARRPANSVLDCSRLTRDWGVSVPGFRHRLAECIANCYLTSLE